ncbi:MAG: hypothetical protein GY757_54595, partial [bacterium]|nr:hypothetical protein [bacterium]
MVPFLTHAETEPPVAIYTTYIDKGRRLQGNKKAEEGIEVLPGRYAAYYPFCSYSPELVALVAGEEVGARLRFIDLPYPDQLVSDRTLFPGDSRQLYSLLKEIHLERSRYIQILAKKTGCRDHDDLWDHLFEIGYQSISTPQFIGNLAAYCYMARMDYDKEVLEQDGTLARERAMAAHIIAELKKNGTTDSTDSKNDTDYTDKSRILVVTGGFHTAGILEMIGGEVSQPERLKLPKEEAQSVLMRYSFDQLDALNGYASGMPSPGYYQRVWDGILEKEKRPFYQTASQLLVEIGRLTREKQLPYVISAADEISALEQAERLAQLREHPEPTREDFLDALRSCYVKGSMDTEGVAVLNMVKELLSGNKIGNVPPGTGMPPIVANFRAVARSLRLKIDTTGRHDTSLDLYRKPSHRKCSRFFHSLVFLEIPFANLLSGPDFVNGTGLDRFRENWLYSWAPQTDSEMIKASLYGSTVQEAAANRLLEEVSRLEEEGKGRSAAETVRFLLMALRMGLHRQAPAILEKIRAGVAEDSNFVSLAIALKQLKLLEQSLEPLEAHFLKELPEMLTAVYRKTCYLTEELHCCPEEHINDSIDGLCVVTELASSPGKESKPGEDKLDGALFYESLARLL